MAIACSAAFTIMSVLSIFKAFLNVTSSLFIAFIMILKIILISIFNSFLVFQINEIFKLIIDNNFFLVSLVGIISIIISLLINYFIFSLFFNKEKFMQKTNSYIMKFSSQIKFL
tara:strand:- start:111 stop:452 length:342 start_codon:yes stop_codon:yes gene_type:complete